MVLCLHTNKSSQGVFPMGLPKNCPVGVARFGGREIVLCDLSSPKILNPLVKKKTCLGTPNILVPLVEEKLA